MTHLTRVLPLILLSFLIACKGPKQIVKDVTVTTYNDPEDAVYATLDTYLDVGSLSVPSLELPIKKPGADISYGTVRLAQTLDGLAQVTVAGNLTALFKLQPGDPKLPNGKDIPIGGLPSLSVVVVPIESINGYVYLTSKNGIVMLGFAIAIKQFDPIGSQVGNVNAFPPFTIKNVRGTAGAFAGEGSGQSGIGVFASFKSSIAGGEAELLAAGASASELLSADPSVMAAKETELKMFRGVVPGRRVGRRLMLAVERLERSGTKELQLVEAEE